MAMGDGDIGEALAELETPKAGYYAIGEEPWWARIWCRAATRRLLPAALGVPLASLIGRLAWRNADIRHETTHRAWVFTRSTDPAELQRFARRHLREYRMQDELFWRPWLVRRMRVAGIERLRPGQGAIVAAVHVGPMPALQMALTRRMATAGRRLYISRWQKITAERYPRGARARYVPEKVARLEGTGARFVGRGGSYPLIHELLRRGEHCWLAIDTAATGRGRVVSLAGRRVRLATGIAALARETGVPILPAAAYRDRWRPAATIGEPIDPADFSSEEELHDRLAAVAGEMILRRPEQMMPDLTMALEWGGAK
ncbi:MAG: LpxL/LpxP family acyltransferase [Solirubrobacterales bacterium]